MFKKFNLLVVFVMLLSVAFTGAASAQEPTGIELAIVLDGSGSFASDQFDIIQHGLAAAIRNPECVAQDGSVRLAVVQFSTEARIEVPLTAITPATADSVADQVANIEQYRLFTNWEAGVNKAIEALDFTSAVQKMNFMTDGQPNFGNLNMGDVRDAGVAAGFDELNAEAVGPAVTENPGARGLLGALVYPQPPSFVTSLDPAPEPGWILEVADAQGYADTICQKLQITLKPTPPDPGGEGPTAKCDPLTNLATFDKKGYTAYVREYVASATDPDTPVEQLQIFIKDSGSGTVWGPFPSGVTFKYNWDVRATPGIRPSTGNAEYIIKGTGPAQVYAVDPTPTMSEIANCPVHDN